MKLNRQMAALVVTVGVLPCLLTGMSGCGKSQNASKPSESSTAASTPTKEATPVPTRTTKSPTPSPTPTKKEYTPASWFQAWAEPQGVLVYSSDLSAGHAERVLHADFYAREVKLNEPFYNEDAQEKIDQGIANPAEVVPDIKAGDSIVVVEAVITAKEDCLLHGFFSKQDSENSMDYPAPMNMTMDDFGVEAGNTVATYENRGSLLMRSNYLRPTLAAILGQSTLLQEPFTEAFLEEHYGETAMPIEWPEGTSILITSQILPTGSFVGRNGGTFTFRLDFWGLGERLFRASDFNEPDGQVQNYVLSRNNDELGLKGPWTIDIDLSAVISR